MSSVLAIGMFSSFKGNLETTFFEVTQITLTLALVLIPLFILIEAGIATIRYLMGEGGWIDYRKFLGYILLWFFTSQYIPIMGGVNSLVNVCVGAVENHPIATDVDIFSTLNKAAYVQQLKITGKKQIEDVEPGFLNTIGSAISGAFDFANLFQTTLVGAVTKGITTVIRVLVEGISIMLTGILLIIGPLAIAFNMMPFVGDGIMKNWFGTWLSIKCWTITMTIIDIVQVKFFESYISTPSTNTQKALESITTDTTFTLAINVGFIICYIMTPMITNYYVKGAGGNMLSAAIGAGSTVLAAAKTGGTSLVTKLGK